VLWVVCKAFPCLCDASCSPSLSGRVVAATTTSCSRMPPAHVCTAVGVALCHASDHSVARTAVVTSRPSRLTLCTPSRRSCACLRHSRRTLHHYSAAVPPTASKNLPKTTRREWTSATAVYHDFQGASECASRLRWLQSTTTLTCLRLGVQSTFGGVRHNHQMPA
jgi:hypothetical protein